MFSIVRLLALFGIIWYVVKYLLQNVFPTQNQTNSREEGKVTIQQTEKQKASKHKEKVGEYVENRL